MENLYSVVRLGACAVIRHKGKYLLGYRTGKHAPNCWAFPGGHVEFGEHPFDAAIRETKEETNLDIEVCDDWDAGWSSDFYETEGKHFVALFIRCNVKNPENLENLEPHKLKEWKWFTADEIFSNLAQDLMPGTKKLRYDLFY
jgi:8-oxo-dGTP diphosphatase